MGKGEEHTDHKIQLMQEGMLIRERRIIPTIQLVEREVDKVSKKVVASHLVRPIKVLLGPLLPHQTRNLND